MTTHVLIVDANTLRWHLEHSFVGTGMGNTVLDFDNNDRSELAGQTENTLASMMADGLRMRAGDQVIFYLQQSQRGRIAEGKFFGVFRTLEDGIFVDDNTPGQYLRAELHKSLTLRALIEPEVVYPEGVTEWEALDEIRHIQAPYQMLWSLIYRKLKGMRGNTMITPYEAERLVYLIRLKNGRRPLEVNGRHLSFDAVTQQIVIHDGQQEEYEGRRDVANIIPRLIAKHDAGNSFEAHLQAYITQHLGIGLNASLDDAVLSGATVDWLGNEVSCGVGMQRIDVMAEANIEGHRTLAPIELKAYPAKAANTTQLQRYIDWVEQYYLPNRYCDIQPVLIARAISGQQRNRARFREFVAAAHGFNENNPEHPPLKYIELEVHQGDLHFQEMAI